MAPSNTIGKQVNLQAKPKASAQSRGLPLVFRHLVPSKKRINQRSLFGEVGEEALPPELANSFAPKEWPQPDMQGLTHVERALLADADRLRRKYGALNPRYQVPNLPRNGDSNKFNWRRTVQNSLAGAARTSQMEASSLHEQASALQYQVLDQDHLRPSSPWSTVGAKDCLNEVDVDIDLASDCPARWLVSRGSSATTAAPDRSESRATVATDMPLASASRPSTPWQAELPVDCAAESAREPTFGFGASEVDLDWAFQSPRHLSPLGLGKRFNLQKLEGWFKKIDKDDSGVIEARELIIELRRNKEMLRIFEAIEEAAGRADGLDDNEGGCRLDVDTDYNTAVHGVAAQRALLSQIGSRQSRQKEHSAPVHMSQLKDSHNEAAMEMTRRDTADGRAAKIKAEIDHIKEMVRGVFSSCRETVDDGRPSIGSGRAATMLEYREWLTYFRRSAVLLEYYTEEGARVGGDVDEALHTTLSQEQLREEAAAKLASRIRGQKAQA